MRPVWAMAGYMVHGDSTSLHHWFRLERNIYGQIQITGKLIATQGVERPNIIQFVSDHPSDNSSF